MHIGRISIRQVCIQHGNNAFRIKVVYARFWSFQFLYMGPSILDFSKLPQFLNPTSLHWHFCTPIRSQIWQILWPSLSKYMNFTDFEAWIYRNCLKFVFTYFFIQSVCSSYWTKLLYPKLKNSSTDLHCHRCH